MKQSEFIAAIDLGTSKIIAMAGRRNDQGIISIIAAEKEESGNCIRRGCIYNVEETATKITKLLQRLNAKLTPKIEKIYVGIGGQSIRSETYSISKEIPNTIVTEQLIQSLYAECRQYKPEFVEVLDIVSPEYYLDGRPEMNPIGVQCSKIEVQFKLILGRPSLKRTLQKCIQEKAGVKIAGYIAAPLATAAAVLSETEKELGCALIEFGAGITYLSIYKSKLLRYLVTIPIGGNVITKDICDLNVLEKEAEELKVNSGSALIDFDKNMQIETAKLAEGLYGSREIELNKLNNIIEARIDEILANVSNQIQLSGFAGSLGAGIIITGGGASLKNLTESVKNKLDHPIRLAAVKKILVNQAAEWSQEYANVEVVGLLDIGNDNCAKAVEEPQSHPQSLFGPDEVKVVIPVKPKKEKENIFVGIKKKFDGLSKTLFEFEEEEKGGEGEEEDKKKKK